MRSPDRLIFLLLVCGGLGLVFVPLIYLGVIRGRRGRILSARGAGHQTKQAREQKHLKHHFKNTFHPHNSFQLLCQSPTSSFRMAGQATVQESYHGVSNVNAVCTRLLSGTEAENKSAQARQSKDASLKTLR